MIIKIGAMVKSNKASVMVGFNGEVHISNWVEFFKDNLITKYNFGCYGSHMGMHGAKPYWSIDS